MSHSCMDITYLDNAAQQCSVLVNGLFPLCELWQSGHGGHEAPGVALQHVPWICVWVHVCACLPVYILNCLRSTDTNCLRQNTLTHNYYHVAFKVLPHARRP